jgi:hypothetical protein
MNTPDLTAIAQLVLIGAIIVTIIAAVTTFVVTRTDPYKAALGTVNAFLIVVAIGAWLFSLSVLGGNFINTIVQSL